MFPVFTFVLRVQLPVKKHPFMYFSSLLNYVSLLMFYLFIYISFFHNAA